MATHEAQVRIGEETYSVVSDDDYLRQLGQEFEPLSVALYSTLIRTGDVCIDVGANIGVTSILFGQLGSRVIGFEPSPTTFRFLQRNVERSRLNNIEIVNAGLGAEVLETELMFWPYMVRWTILEPSFFFDLKSARQFSMYSSSKSLPQVLFTLDRVSLISGFISFM